MSIAYITITQAANISGLSPSYIYHAIANNKLAASRMLVVPVSALVRLKAEHDSKQKG